jgi:hypothetical protein
VDPGEKECPDFGDPGETYAVMDPGEEFLFVVDPGEYPRDICVGPKGKKLCATMDPEEEKVVLVDPEDWQGP